MSVLPADHAGRARALDIATSFCVQAPAGSGKTELLTQRLLRLLAHVQQPEEILAFTFTRKAAAEMRERLLHSLDEARGFRALPARERDALPAHKLLTLQLATAVLEQDERQGWHLLQNARRLRLNTIDSFTGWLSSQLPLEASLGARALISTDMQAVFAEAIRRTLAALNERDNPSGRALRRLLPHLQNNLQATERLLQEILRKRDQWLPLLGTLEGDSASARAVLETTLRDMLCARLGEARALLAPFRSELLRLCRFAASNLGAHAEHSLHPLAALDDLPPAAATPQVLAHWHAVTGFLLVGSLDGFRSARGLQGKHGFPGQKEARDKEEAAAMKAAFGSLCERLAGAGCLPALQMVARMPGMHYADAQWEVLSALCALLPVLAAQLHVAMQDRGIVDHTETSLAALRALGSEDEPTDLALRLDYRIRHLLVDEFQDTSSMQFHLLEKLTAGWQPGDGRTLFIVGDGMQSCYAFRNAKVSLFLKARNEGIGSVRLEPIDLQVNFRSDSSVVDWVNAVFCEAFPVVDDLARGGVRYSPSAARAPEPLTPGVHVQLWVEDEATKASAETRRQVEAVEVAQSCMRLLRENPGQSVAVLVRSRSHLRAIVPALRKAGLRWNANKIDRLLSYPDIGDLFTLLRTLLSLADATAWLALLRTPFVGLRLADVQELARHAQDNAQSLWSTLQAHEALATLSADAHTRLARCIPLLREARERRQQQPLRTVLEALWIALGGPACLESHALLPNVATFFDLVDEHAAQGDIVDVHALEEALEGSYGSALDPDVNLQLMTIHNAKGLEFDAVLIPGLDCLPRANSKELLLWHEHLDSANRSRPLLGLLPQKGQPDDPLYDYLRFEHQERDALEATRLLYIAVTRAVRTAWLFGCVRADGDSCRAPSSSLLNRILPALLNKPEKLKVRFEPLPVAAGSMPETGLERIASQPLRRLPATWPAKPLHALLPSQADVVEDDPLHRQILARTIGELVHLGLKFCVERGTAWLAQGTTPPLWQTTLAPLCPDASTLDAALATVRQQLRNCVENTELAWLFTGDLREDACELALVDYRGGYRRDFVIDRTFIDAGGIRWIIDYKSAVPAPGASLAQFLEEQGTRHRQQLLNYAALFPAEPPPRLALLFTAIPLLHPLA